MKRAWIAPTAAMLALLLNNALSVNIDQNALEITISVLIDLTAGITLYLTQIKGK